MKKYILILLVIAMTLNSNTKFESRITGGKELDSIAGKEFIVGLGTQFDGFFQVQCAGTLIDSLHVVTAAHCISRDDLHVFTKYHILPEQQLFLQDFQSLTPQSLEESQQSIKGTTVKASRVYRHNGYDLDKVSDIAVLKLEKPINITNYVKLPTVGTTTPILQKNQSLEVLGWGITDPKNQLPSKKLKAITIKALTKEQCIKDSFTSKKSNASTTFSEKDIDNIICAGGLAVQQENEGACQGDSGGPLVYHSPNGPVLVGIVSNGNGPCTEKISGRYTKVEPYLDFIKQSQDGTYESNGILRKGYIQSLPKGYNLLGTESQIDAGTSILTNDVTLIYAYNSKDKTWKLFNIKDGVVPKDLHIPPKSGFWIYKK